MSKFNLLAYILPPEEKVFYTLFEESTKVCHETAVLFNEIVTKGLQKTISSPQNASNTKATIF